MPRQRIQFSPDEMRLIAECKQERLRMRARLGELRRDNSAAAAMERGQLRRALRQFTDASLAIKFETTICAIWNIDATG